MVVRSGVRSWASARRLLIGLPIALSVVPPLLIGVLVSRHARNVPWKDQWGMVGYMAEVTQGVLNPAWFTWQVNEHRMPVAFAIQGVLAWWTRWDLRCEAWLNVVLAGLTLLALAGLVRQTIAPRSVGVAAWVFLACSVLTFSGGGGINWTWGTMNANFLVGLATAVLACQLSGWAGRWRQTIWLMTTTTLAAFTFGTGLVLLLAVPAALAVPTTQVPRRALHVLATAAWAGVVLVIYFTGWHHRFGHPRAVMHWDRLSDYAQYVAAYLGAVTGTQSFAAAMTAGIAMTIALVLVGGWVWHRGPAARAAIVPWVVLAGTAVANAIVTSYGRMEDGLGTALLVRYVPTGAWCAIGLAGVIGTALIEASARAKGLRWVLVAATVLGVGVASRTYYEGWMRGAAEMATLASRLERGAPCLVDCATASDACLLLMCWDARVARQGCPILAAARIGPFARAPRPERADTSS